MQKKFIDVARVLNELPDDLPYKSSVKRVLIQAPEEDVVGVKHGEWIEIGSQNPRCSYCNHYTLLKGKYCPNCGANMGGGDTR